MCIRDSHNTDGIIVDAVCGEKNYHFRFDSLPCYEISVPRRETKNLKEVIYQMNAEMPEYKASYDAVSYTHLDVYKRQVLQWRVII